MINYRCQDQSKNTSEYKINMYIAFIKQWAYNESFYQCTKT